MKIIDYFYTDDKSHWLAQIQKSDWSAGQYLCELLKSNTLKSLTGEGTHLFLLIDEGELISFCTLAEKDDVQPTTLMPWIGWVYTFPKYRGHRYAGKLLAHAEKIAKAEGMKSTYISTNHTNLYEKYGYAFLCTAKDIQGERTSIYQKDL